MSASIHPIRPASYLPAARMVSHAPDLYPAEVRATAASVLASNGETAAVLRLTGTDLVTAQMDAALAEARRIAQAVANGERASLPVLATAVEALSRHGFGDGDAKLLIHLEAAAMVTRMQIRRDRVGDTTRRMIAGELMAGLIFAAFGLAVLVIGMAL